MALKFVDTLRAVVSKPPRESAAQHAAIFLDKDGTLLDDAPYNVCPDRMHFAKGAAAGLRLLSSLHMPLYVVSNQPGVGLGYFADRELNAVQTRLSEMFGDCGATLGGFYWCPHAPQPNGRVACLCRKPMPGLLLQAAAEHAVDTKFSWMVGDIVDDIEAGRRAGCRTILIDNGNETEWQPGAYRAPHYLVRDLYEAARVIADVVRTRAQLGRPGPHRSHL